MPLVERFLCFVVGFYMVLFGKVFLLLIFCCIVHR